MAKLKRGKFSAEEITVILSASGNGTSVETLAKLLNRSEKSVKNLIHEKSIPLVSDNKDPALIPDAPQPLPVGYAKKHFEIPDSKKPGEKRKGMAIMTEGGSEAGDDFLKADCNGLFPMSSKHSNCVTKASNE